MGGRKDVRSVVPDFEEREIMGERQSSNTPGEHYKRTQSHQRTAQTEARCVASTSMCQRNFHRVTVRQNHAAPMEKTPIHAKV